MLLGARSSKSLLHSQSVARRWNWVNALFSNKINGRDRRFLRKLRDGPQRAVLLPKGTRLFSTTLVSAVPPSLPKVIDAFRELTVERRLEPSASQEELVQQLQRLQTTLIQWEDVGWFTQRLHASLKELQETRVTQQLSNGVPQNELVSRKTAGLLRNLKTKISRYWTSSPLQPEVRNGPSSCHNPLPLRIPQELRFQCLYIWGGVGQGKTLLMDTFYTSTPLKRKLRAHFHNFILEIQQRLHQIRTHQESTAGRNLLNDSGSSESVVLEDPVLRVAYDLARSYSLICLDEFQVVHISDAMILKKLFEALLHFGTIVVVTSNRPPQDLYKGGLNRDRFLPFIWFLENYWNVFHISTERDYRQRKRFVNHSSQCREIVAFSQYNCPPRPIEAVIKHMQHIACTSEAPSPSEVDVMMGRTLQVPYEFHGIGLFRFEDLCGSPVGTGDYIAIASNYHTVFLYDIWSMDKFEDFPDVIRRFIQLVDVVYERTVRVIFDARAPLLRLGGPSSTAQAFEVFCSFLRSSFPASLQDFLQRLQAQLKASPKQSFAAALGCLTGAPEKVTTTVAQTVSDALQCQFILEDPRERRRLFSQSLMAALRFHSENYQLTPDPYFLSVSLPESIAQLPFNFGPAGNSSVSLDSVGTADNRFAFDRTMSRIRDMLTSDYLEQHKRQWDIQRDV